MCYLRTSFSYSIYIMANLFSVFCGIYYTMMILYKLLLRFYRIHDFIAYSEYRNILYL